MTPRRAEYTAKMKLQLDELNAKLDKLEAKADEIKQDAQVRYKSELTKLRHESKLAMTQFAELKTAGEDSWDKMVAEMDKIGDAFTKSFHYFKTHI